MSSEKNPTRDRILKATWTLLEDGGASAIRMSDIAKAAKISRQALYLHFPNRAELLAATTLYLDQVYDIEGQLKATREARSGEERLVEWVKVWGNYIPKIYGMAKALMAMQDSDSEAKAAWTDRMQAVRGGCAAAVKALAREKVLTGELSETEAVDALWTQLSVRVWEQLCVECGWSQERYLAHMQRIARLTLVG